MVWIGFGVPCILVWMCFFFCHVNRRLTRCDAALESDVNLMDVAKHSLVFTGACFREV